MPFRSFFCCLTIKFTAAEPVDKERRRETKKSCLRLSVIYQKRATKTAEEEVGRHLNFTHRVTGIAYSVRKKSPLAASFSLDSMINHRTFMAFIVGAFGAQKK
jgi:hypothetical protein